MAQEDPIVAWKNQRSHTNDWSLKDWAEVEVERS